MPELQEKFLKADKEESDIMSVVEGQLASFFSSVNVGWHAAQVETAIRNYIPYMESYPELVSQYVDRFLPYFTMAPASNHEGALSCLAQIAAAVPQVKPRIVEAYGAILYEYKPFWLKLGSQSRIFAIFEYLLKLLSIPLSLKDRIIQDIVRSNITLHQPIIVIMGAGFSYDTMPITNELKPLLVTFLRKAGIDSPLELIEKDDKAVWTMVKSHISKFKDMFAGRCSLASPAPQHRNLARMIHDKQVSHVISFNWDNLIEKAYVDLYGKPISKVVNDGTMPSEPSLWKLHGDVDALADDWIMPYEDGRVFKSVIASLDDTIKTNAPNYTLIVGYNEGEKNVRDLLIDPLTSSVPNIIRVRPNYTGDEDKGLAENAKTFFQRLTIYSEIEGKKNKT